MEETNRQASYSKVRRGPAHEGPKNHLIAFAVSLVLTALAFFAAANHLLSTGFVIFLLSAMAVVQVIVQLTYWMHMKDRGHFFPTLFLSMGALIVVAFFVAAFYWMWW